MLWGEEGGKGLVERLLVCGRVVIVTRMGQGQEGNEVVKMAGRAHDAVDEQHRRISSGHNAAKFLMNGRTSFGDSIAEVEG